MDSTIIQAVKNSALGLDQAFQSYHHALTDLFGALLKYPQVQKLGTTMSTQPLFFVKLRDGFGYADDVSPKLSLALRVLTSYSNCGSYVGGFRPSVRESRSLHFYNHWLWCDLIVWRVDQFGHFGVRELLSSSDKIRYVRRGDPRVYPVSAASVRKTLAGFREPTPAELAICEDHDAIFALFDGMDAQGVDDLREILCKYPIELPVEPSLES